MISNNSFLVVFEDFLYIMSCHLQVVIAFLLLSQFVFFFSCLIAVARTYITMLNKSDECGHLCPALSLERNAFCFSLLSMM